MNVGPAVDATADGGGDAVDELAALSDEREEDGGDGSAGEAVVVG